MSEVSPYIVSFPHYFLKATGHLAEQLKTREWIVARITSITEGVVDFKVDVIGLLLNDAKLNSFVE